MQVFLFVIFTLLHTEDKLYVKKDVKSHLEGWMFLLPIHFSFYTRLTYNSKNRQDDKAGHGLQKGSLVIDRSNTVLSHHAWSQNNTMLKAKMFSARTGLVHRGQETAWQPPGNHRSLGTNEYSDWLSRCQWFLLVTVKLTAETQSCRPRKCVFPYDEWLVKIAGCCWVNIIIIYYSFFFP